MNALLNLMHRLKASGERRLCVIEGSQAACIERMQHIFPHDGLWLGDGPAVCDPQPMHHTMPWLGQEYSFVVINGFSGLNPEMLGAVGGAVKAGGWLCLLMPERQDWETFSDPDYVRYVALPELVSRCAARFLQRMRTILNASDAVYWLDATTGRCSSLASEVLMQPWHLEADDAGCLSREQRQTLNDLLLVPTSYQPYVLMADRGRGKSAVMGLAARAWLAQGYSVALTAPALQSAQSVLRHAGDVSNQIQFVSPEGLAEGTLNADVVLVDEAAAIPAELLQQIQRQYVRVVYATTVHGYEGSGHGFELRLCRWLQQQYPTMTLKTMSAPLRWSERDPLEPLLARILLLNAEIQPPLITAPCELSLMRADSLAENECLLEQVVGLLVLAHYQTSPTDVRLLLDSPDVLIGLWRSGPSLVGVALLVEEGPIAEPLASQICAGVRRPRGQLLPQTLLAHCGYEEAAAFRYLRVMRIAIHPDCQQQGIGSAFLQAVMQAILSQTDFIGTSFSATPALVQFWSRLGWLPVRIGLSKDTATAGHAVVFLHPCHERARVQLQHWQDAFQRDLPDWLAFQLSTLAPELVVQLCHATSAAEPLPVQTLKDLRLVTDHHRSLDHALPAIRCLMQHRQALQQLSATEQAVLIARFWQGKEWSWLCRRFEVNGQKAMVKWLRAVIKKLLSLAHSREQKITANME